MFSARLADELCNSCQVGRKGMFSACLGVFFFPCLPSVLLMIVLRVINLQNQLWCIFIKVAYFGEFGFFQSLFVEFTLTKKTKPQWVIQYGVLHKPSHEHIIFPFMFFWVEAVLFVRINYLSEICLNFFLQTIITC